MKIVTTRNTLRTQQGLVTPAKGVLKFQLLLAPKKDLE